MTVAPGTLYIVATPIGNLLDITQRALVTLSEVDVICAEDTRTSGRLLSHYQITTPCVAFHDHNEQQKAAAMVERLQRGESLALISDAGTPLINDPGYRLVMLCRAEQIPVVPVPGACAAITALCAAGVATDRFSYEGFLPAKANARQQRLEALKEHPATLVFYESPHRILDTLADVVAVMGAERPLVLARELTKTYETFAAKPAGELLDWIKADANQQKGEMVLIISGFTPDEGDDIPLEARQTLSLLCQELPLKKAAALTAQIHQQKKNALYRWGLEQGL